jgi:hypothetical protein
MANSDAQLRTFNMAIANRALRWWEVQTSEPGNDRDVLYMRFDGFAPGDLRPPVTFVRITAEHREHGAALSLEVVDSIPASETRNISLPGAPVEGHGEIRAEARADRRPACNCGTLRPTIHHSWCAIVNWADAHGYTRPETWSD